MNSRGPLAVSAFAVMCAATLSGWAWLVVDGATVPAGIGSDLELVSKFEGLVIGPLLLIGLPTALFLLIPRIEPRRDHLWASAKAYGAIWVTVYSEDLLRTRRSCSARRTGASVSLRT